MLSTYIPTDENGEKLSDTTGETVSVEDFEKNTYITIYYRDKSKNEKKSDGNMKTVEKKLTKSMF